MAFRVAEGTNHLRRCVNRSHGEKVVFDSKQSHIVNRTPHSTHARDGRRHHRSTDEEPHHKEVGEGFL